MRLIVRLFSIVLILISTIVFVKAQPQHDLELRENITNYVGSYINSNINTGFGDTWKEAYNRKMTYDDKGNPVVFFQKKNELGEWYDNLKIEYEYDNYNYLKSVTEFSKFDGEWYFSRKTIYTRLENDNISTIETANFKDGKWINNQRISYQYIKGLLSERTTQVWSGDSWQNYSYYTIARENGHIKDILQFNWENGGWLIQLSIEYTYDKSGNNTETLITSHSKGNQFLSRELRTFNNFLMTTYIVQQKQSQDWVNTSKTEYFYIEGNILTDQINYVWDGTNWLRSTKISQGIDDNSNIVLLQNYNFTNNEWKIATEATLNYNEHGLLTNYTKKSNYDGSWSNSVQFIYDYTATSVNEKDETIKASVSPNPANDMAFVNFSLDKPGDVEISIYDMSGIKVKTETINNAPQGINTYAIEGYLLNAGLYMCKIKSGGGEIEAKVVIIR